MGALINFGKAMLVAGYCGSYHEDWGSKELGQDNGEPPAATGQSFDHWCNRVFTYGQRKIAEQYGYAAQ